MANPPFWKQFSDGMAASLVSFPVILTLGYALGLYESCPLFSGAYLSCLFDVYSTSKFFNVLTPVTLATAGMISMGEAGRTRGLFLITFLAANLFILIEYLIGLGSLMPKASSDFSLPILILDTLWISISVTLGAILGYRAYKWIRFQVVR
ncbi:hypothetical protein HYR53_10685 [Candidatus Acetothermia bacterium]|nr:hypothetical protein [Candidatus Acetothermia bacterium]